MYPMQVFKALLHVPVKSESTRKYLISSFYPHGTFSVNKAISVLMQHVPAFYRTAPCNGFSICAGVSLGSQTQCEELEQNEML